MEEIRIVWTEQATKGLHRTLKYIEEKWTDKEILKLEKNIQEFSSHVKRHPDLFPQSIKHPRMRIGRVDENNYIVNQAMKAEK